MQHAAPGSRIAFADFAPYFIVSGQGGYAQSGATSMFPVRDAFRNLGWARGIEAAWIFN
jgi:hypothetical protein